MAWRRTTGPLFQRAAATLGLGLALPGAAMLLWGSPGAGARPLLQAWASGLCAAGGALLILALALGLGLRPQGPSREPPGEAAPPRGARDQFRPRQLAGTPSEADAPPTVWTVTGRLGDETPPPRYDAVVVVLGGRGPRSSVSESEAAEGLQTPVPRGLEPLTPPPRYETALPATVFCFPPAAPGL